MEKKASDKLFSIFVVYFWPIAFNMMRKDLLIDKSTLMSGRPKMFTLRSMVFALFGFVFLYNAIFVHGFHIVMFVVGLLITVPCVLVFVYVRKLNSIASRYQEYIDGIVNSKMRKIEDIARFASVSSETAIEDLKCMVEKGYLKDGYVDEEKQEFVLEVGKLVVRDEETKKTKCKCCSASCIVTIGKEIECEYCGNAIKVKY